MARILHIEDNESVRGAIKLLLTRCYRHSVISIVDTRKAESVVDKWRPDLVITDHELGVGKEKGLELALRLKAKGVKVAMLSASLGAQHAAQKAGVLFFHKPCDMGALLKEMRVTP